MKASADTGEKAVVVVVVEAAFCWWGPFALEIVLAATTPGSDSR